MKTLIEFEIDYIEVNKTESTATVDGKCTIDPISTDTNLNATYKLEWLNPNAVGIRSPRAFDVKTIDIVVFNIYAFHRNLTSLSQGYTATIEVKGDIGFLKKLESGSFIAYCVNK